MAASRAEISLWFDTAIERKSTHMIVVCDTFDHEDYPVYCATPKDCRKSMQHYESPESMSKVMEVYDMSIDKNTQMREPRAYHPPERMETA